MEASLNLIWGYYSAKGFYKQAEEANQIVDNQGRCWKGQPAINMAIKKVLTYKWIWILCATVINVNNDLKACFNNMVKAYHNLACLSKGTDEKYICLHAQMQQQFRCHIKHAQGILSNFNTLTNDNPWYSAGQGARDAALQYATQLDSMTCTYEAEAQPLLMNNPDKTWSINQNIDGFVDDRTFLIGSKTENHALLQLQMQTNLNLWNNIVKATGGELNPPKCGWAHFRWIFDKHGQPS